jgi:hypothetical protein
MRKTSLDRTGNEFFEEDNRVIQGVHLVGASYNQDMWYPYL